MILVQQVQSFESVPSPLWSGGRRVHDFHPSHGRPWLSGKSESSNNLKVGGSIPCSEIGELTASGTQSTSFHMPLSTLYLPPGRCERLPCVTIMCQLNLICPQNSFLSASVHLNELWSREDGRVSGLWSHVSSSLPDGALTCICG